MISASGGIADQLSLNFLKYNKYSAIQNRIFLAYWAGALQGATTGT